jgi:hypothetical protein
MKKRKRIPEVVKAAMVCGIQIRKTRLSDSRYRKIAIDMKICNRNTIRERDNRV